MDDAFFRHHFTPNRLVPCLRRGFFFAAIPLGFAPTKAELGGRPSRAFLASGRIRDAKMILLKRTDLETTPVYRDDGSSGDVALEFFAIRLKEENR
jgi:hypothetical protein